MITRRQFLKLTAATGAGLAWPKLAKASGPLKCVGGWPGWDKCQSVGAAFGYQWDNPSYEHGRIPNVKGEDELPPARVYDIKTAARSGVVMFGNEFSLKGWSPDKQARLTRKFFDIAFSENPTCYVLGLNDIAWCPQKGWLGYENIEAVANRYAQLYGAVPPFKGVGFHAYHWPGHNNAKLENVIWWTTNLIRQVYGNVDVHLTETGSLVGEEHALASMPKIQEGLGAGVDAWFWFVSHSVPGCSIWDGNWNLTRVGRAYKEM